MSPCPDSKFEATTLTCPSSMYEVFPAEVEPVADGVAGLCVSVAVAEDPCALAEPALSVIFTWVVINLSASFAISSWLTLTTSTYSGFLNQTCSRVVKYPAIVSRSCGFPRRMIRGSKDGSICTDGYFATRLFGLSGFSKAVRALSGRFSDRTIIRISDSSGGTSMPQSSAMRLAVITS